MARNWTITGLLLIGAAGCGPTPAPMNISANTADGSPAQVAGEETETDAARKRLVGQWKGVFEIASELDESELPALDRRQLESTEMTIDFREDGTAVMQAHVTLGEQVESAERNSRWNVVQASSNRATVESLEENMAPESIEIEFQGNDRFMMDLPQERAHIGRLRFDRQ